MEKATKQLKRALKGKEIDPWAEGTVIRWLSGGRYLYAVIKSNGRWWITGTAAFYGQQVLSYLELLEILSRAGVADIQVVAEWDDI